MLKKLFALSFIVLSLSSCHVGRFVTRNYANITDHKIFPSTPIKSIATGSEYKLEESEIVKNLTFKTKKSEEKLDDYLREHTTTTGFLVLKEGKIIFENYYRGYQKEDISNIFSVSKSITGLLIGIAVDEGLIKSIEDPVTNYIEDLRDVDPMFKRLKIKHLLEMRSGLKYTEAYGSPFAHMAKLYYGLNQVKQISSLSFESEPGSKYSYQSASTAILGMVIESASGKELGTYLEEKIWQPMNMEHDASWSVDDKRNRSTKAYCCLNLTARDLAKIGLLMLNGGNWNGKQIISEQWVEKTITPNFENGCYQNQWYNVKGRASSEGQTYLFDTKEEAEVKAGELELEHYEIRFNSEIKQYYIYFCTSEFYGHGILNQYLYVHPEKDVVIVRLGEKWDRNYLPILRKIAMSL